MYLLYDWRKLSEDIRMFTATKAAMRTIFGWKKERGRRRPLFALHINNIAPDDTRLTLIIK